MSPPSLRLAAIRRAIGAAPLLIDVGTDHALLPLAWLAKHPTAQALGIDRSDLPLQRAKLHRESCPQGVRLSLRCQDGIGDLLPSAPAVVSMSGLGGLSMAQILDRSESLGHPHFERLVLAPNDRAPELRAALLELGWSIIDEDACWERDHFYPIMIAARPGASVPAMSPLELRFGPKLLEKGHPALLRWLCAQGRRLHGIALKRAPQKAPKAVVEQLFAVRAAYRQHFASHLRESSETNWIDSPILGPAN